MKAATSVAIFRSSLQGPSAATSLMLPSQSWEGALTELARAGLGAFVARSVAPEVKCNLVCPDVVLHCPPALGLELQITAVVLLSAGGAAIFFCLGLCLGRSCGERRAKPGGKGIWLGTTALR